MANRCVLLASALLLNFFSSSHSQDVDKKRELERRYSELLGKAASMHVELARWLEKEGQLAWARYQYEWALDVSPGHADASAALAREGVKWENKRSRFESLDKSLIKGKVKSVVPQANQPLIDYEVELQSTADKKVYFTFAIRKKSTGYAFEFPSIVPCEAKSKTGRAHAWWEEIHPDAYAQFKQCDLKDLEVVVTSVFREDPIHARQLAELLKRITTAGLPIGAALSKLGTECNEAGLGDLAVAAYRKSITYDRDNAVARRSLGFEKVDYDFAVSGYFKENGKGQLTRPPRWSPKEERDLRARIFDAASKETIEKCEHEGKEARTNGNYIMYPLEQLTIEDTEEALRLVGGWMEVFTSQVGLKVESFRNNRRIPYFFKASASPEYPSLELHERAQRSWFLESVVFDWFLRCFRWDRSYKRGYWVYVAISAVYTKTLSGYCFPSRDDLGTSNSSRFPDDRQPTDIVVWQDSIRESALTGDFLPAEQLIGIPVNSHSLKGQLQLWSLFHYLSLKQPEKCGKFIAEFSQDEKDKSGVNKFKQVFGDLSGFTKTWIQFVLENY